MSSPTAALAGSPVTAPITDAYFGLYCLAMGTGRARSAAEIAAHLEAAGFTDIRHRKTARPFITSVVEARKP